MGARARALAATRRQMATGRRAGRGGGTAASRAGGGRAGT